MILALCVGLPLLALVVGAALLVDDWSRDLTTNQAVTSEDNQDPELRPIETKATYLEIQTAAARQSGRYEWAFHEEAKPLPGDSPLAGVAAAGRPPIYLEHRTAVFQFVDDVWLVVEDLGDRRRVHAESRSRIGKGDLGQNPRNLRELLGLIRDEL